MHKRQLQLRAHQHNGSERERTVAFNSLLHLCARGAVVQEWQPQLRACEHHGGKGDNLRLSNASGNFASPVRATRGSGRAAVAAPCA